MELFPFSKIAEVLWIDKPRYPNSYIWFRAVLDLKAVSHRVVFRLISTVPYQLFCNGMLAGWGPWRGTRKVLWITEHDISSFLHAGKNEMWLLMHDPVVPSNIRDSIQPLWLGEVISGKEGGQKILLTSRADLWSYQLAAAWEQDVLASNYLRNFCEIYKATKSGNHPHPDIRSSWHSCLSYPQAILGRFQIKPTLESPPLGRDIKPQRFRWKSLERIPRWDRRFAEDFRRAVWKRWHQCLGDWTVGFHKFVPPSLKPLKYVPPKGEKISFKSTHWKTWHEEFQWQGKRQKHIALLLDFGITTSGLWHFTAKSPKPVRLNFLHSEHLINDGVLKHEIVDSNMVDIPSGETTWTSFQQNAGRYVLIIIEGIQGNLKLNFSIRSTMYNPDKLLAPAIKDRFLKKALASCIETVPRCMSDGFIDSSRERAQWIGDSLLIAEVAADVFDYPEAWRRLLVNIIESSIPDKMLKAAIPGDMLDKIPLYDLFTVISAVRYAERYASEQLDYFLEFITERVHFYYRYLNPFSLLENVPQRNFVDWTWEYSFPPLTSQMVENWVIGNQKLLTGDCPYDFLRPRTRGINAVLNAQWLETLEAACRIAKKTHKKNLLQELQSLREKGLQSYQQLLWDKDKGLVRECVPELPSSYAPSEHANFAALYAGLLTPEQAERVISNCFDPQRKMIRVFSPYGARFVVAGLLRYNKKQLAYRYLKSIYSPMLKRDKTLWEDLRGQGSRCHGWSAYPLWLYIKGCLPFRLNTL